MSVHQIPFVIVLFLSFLLLSIYVENKKKIPMPLSLLTFSFICFSFIEIDFNFDAIMYTVLPLLLISDAMLLNIKDLQKYRNSILYLAVIAVIVGIIFGIITLLPLFDILNNKELNISLAFIATIVTISMATDAIAVVSVFSNFKQVPKRIKFLIESESLFNDATAMILLYLIIIPLLILENNFNIKSLITGTIWTIFGAIFIGASCGFIFANLMAAFKDAKAEFVIILLTAFMAFFLAETIHVSGILAIITAMIIFAYFMNKNVEIYEQRFNSEESKNKGLKHTLIFKNIKENILTTKAKLEENEKIVELFSLIAITVLFISLAATINIEDLILHWKLILIFFVVLTIIRFIMVYFVNFSLKKECAVSFKDKIIITLGGVKGGLSILLVHTIPNTVVWKELATIIVSGQVILSLFIYIPLLIYLIPKFYTENKN